MSAPAPGRGSLLLSLGGLFLVPALLLGGWTALVFLDEAGARAWALAAARPLGATGLVDLAVSWPWAVGAVAALFAFYALHFLNDGWRAGAFARTGRVAPDPMAAAASILAAVVLGSSGALLLGAAVLVATDPSTAVRFFASFPFTLPAHELVDELADDLPAVFGGAVFLFFGAWLEARGARYALHPEKRRRRHAPPSIDPPSIDPPRQSFNGRQT